MDATFYLDRLGDNRGRGLKEGAGISVCLHRETQGDKPTSISSMIRSTTGIGMPSFIKHQQKLPYDFYLKGDINYVSDNDYPHDFDEDLPEGDED